MSRLTTQFNSKCQDIFSRIDVSKCQDYEADKKRLREGYNLGPEAYRKELGKLERELDQNFKEYAVKLNEVFIKWLQGTNCKTFD